MTKTARSPRSTARVIPLRRGTTLEMVRLACPDAAQTLRISESFGLAVLDSDGIRDLHERLVVEEREPALQQYLLLVGGLRAMAAGEHRHGDVLASYLLRSLSVAGYAPSFNACTRCGLAGSHTSFHPAAGGVLCPDCRMPGSARPAEATVRLLGALLAGDWVVVDSAEAVHRKEARSLVTAYLNWHLERDLRSLRLAASE